jgi:hypothetical protein
MASGQMAGMKQRKKLRPLFISLVVVFGAHAAAPEPKL